MRIVLIALSLLFSLDSLAQITMSQVFKTMPETIVPYLSENNRLDLIDFVASNMKAVVNNQLDGKTELIKLTDTEATLKLSESLKMELRLLNVTDSDSITQIICMIRTYSNGEDGSQISFFSPGWKQLLTSDYITHPDGVYVANFDSQSESPSLLLTFNHPFDQPASEEQKVLDGTLMKFNWHQTRFKKD